MKKFDPDEIIRYDVRFARSDKMKKINGKKFHVMTSPISFKDFESAKGFAENRAFFDDKIISARVDTVFGDGFTLPHDRRFRYDNRPGYSPEPEWN